MMIMCSDTAWNLDVLDESVTNKHIKRVSNEKVVFRARDFSQLSLVNLLSDPNYDDDDAVFSKVISYTAGTFCWLILDSVSKQDNDLENNKKHVQFAVDSVDTEAYDAVDDVDMDQLNFYNLNQQFSSREAAPLDPSDSQDDLSSSFQKNSGSS